MINQFQEGGESFHGWVYIEVIFLYQLRIFAKHDLVQSDIDVVNKGASIQICIQTKVQVTKIISKGWVDFVLHRADHWFEALDHSWSVQEDQLRVQRQELLA